MNEDCLLCGAPQPVGHVMVLNEYGQRYGGRVCSSHTLREVILDSSDRFLVEIVVSTPAVNALERAQARRTSQPPERRPGSGVDDNR